MCRFSIIVGFRDRDFERVQNSLDSLSAQSVTDFELIFVDYGSKSAIASEIKELVENYSFAKYYYNYTRGWFWNRSHALNCGIQKAKGEISILWDIDLMVNPDFLKKIGELDFQREFTSHRCFYMPKNGSKPKEGESASYEAFQHAYVGLCCVKTDWLHQINYFDEYFQVWGAEDDDLYDRLQKTGLSKRLINADEIQVYHQWHPTHAMALPDLWYLQMVEKLVNPNRITQASPGKVLLRRDRPALQIRKGEKYMSGKEIKLDLSNKTLLYNSLISEVLKMSDGDLSYVNFQYPQMNPNAKSQLLIKSFNGLMDKIGWNLRLINRKQEEDHLLKENIFSFLKYFVGRQRQEFRDYYLDWRKDGFLFILMK